MLLLLNSLHMVEVDLIGDEVHSRHFLALKCFLHDLEPIFQIFKTLVTRDVISEHDCIGLVHIGFDHLPEDTLASNVPDLQAHEDVLRQL